jgi:hypothetical protein
MIPLVATDPFIIPFTPTTTVRLGFALIRAAVRGFRD